MAIRERRWFDRDHADGDKAAEQAMEIAKTYTATPHAALYRSLYPAAFGAMTARYRMLWLDYQAALAHIRKLEGRE